MTGRAAGYCAGYPMPGFMNPTPGGGFRGRGRGFGRGRGWGWRAGHGAAAFGPYPAAPFAPPVRPDTELDTLKAQADHFAGALDEIRKRIDELQAEQKEA